MHIYYIWVIEKLICRVVFILTLELGIDGAANKAHHIGIFVDIFVMSFVG